jgi:phage anti-repressor protein
MADSLDLVPVFTGTLNAQTVQLCDARTLHTFMVVLRDFSNWIKGRIRKYGFIEGVDFITISRSPDLASGNLDSPNRANQVHGGEVVAKSGENLGGRPTIDYHLSLDMAKELAMVENNAKGREARRYFIDCEKRALAQLSSNPCELPAPPKAMLRALPPSTTTLQLMLITTTHGQSTVEILPADALPGLLLKGDGIFTARQITDIAGHASMRMIKEVCKIEVQSEAEQMKKQVRTLHTTDLAEVAKQAYLELSLRGTMQ